MNDTITRDKSSISIHLGKPHNVILFNDENHDMVEVVTQIMKAINCNIQTATRIMMEAHKSGRAVVFTGHKEKCELVSSILEEIRLGVKIEQA